VNIPIRTLNTMLIKKNTIYCWVLIFLCSFLMADNSWMIYDDTEVDVVEIIIDPEDLDWIYDNVESDSLHPAVVHYSNE